MKIGNFIKTLLIALAFAVSAPNVLAATAEGVVLDPIPVDSGDTPSLQRGASLFVNYCLSCHGAAYMRYERLAYDLDIPIETLADEYMYTTDKPGDLMETAMSADDAKNWFGVAPPDLTLVSRVRKNDWLYTYLRGFYMDENSANGWNNSLFENVAMPHVLHELQGIQTLVGHVEEGAAETAANQNIVGDAIFELQKEGSLSPEEFDSAMYDLVNFLSYLAEPAQLQRRSIGVWVLAWLVVLFIVSYLLKKEYWRDVD